MGIAAIAKESSVTDNERFEDRDDLVVSIERLSIRDLHIDTDEEGYQRPVHQEAVQRIVRDFDPNQFDVITVSMRDDGSYWVVDGHHRVAAAKELGMTAITCRIIYGLTRKEEATLFVKLAKGRRLIAPIDKLRADISAGNEDAIRLREICHENGFMPDRSSAYQPREMSADILFPLRSISTAREVYDMDRGETLDKVLTVIREAWHQTEPGAALKQQNMRALARVISRYDDIDLERMVRVLRETSPTVLRSRGHARGQALGEQPGVGIAIEIIELYNRSIRGRATGKLPIDRIM